MKVKGAGNGARPAGKGKSPNDFGRMLVELHRLDIDVVAGSNPATPNTMGV